jgi:hypothetical protein
MKAKRGDAIAIVTESRDYVIGRPSSTATRVEVGIVTSITRDGVVKAFRNTWSESPQPIERVVGFKQCIVIPSDVVSPADVMTVAKAHHWPGHPNQPKAFDSLEALREALKPYRNAAPAAA